MSFKKSLYSAQKYEEKKAYERAYCRQIRLAVIAFLGDKCSHCGITDERVLQVDHIYGGGTAEMRKLGPISMYKKVMTGVPGYQLLCANCNWIKKRENNEVRR